MNWTAEKVRTGHTKTVALWYKKDGVPTSQTAMLWVYYDKDKAPPAEYCSLYKDGEKVSQAHMISAEEMAIYLNKYVATIVL